MVGYKSPKKSLVNFRVLQVEESPVEYQVEVQAAPIQAVLRTVVNHVRAQGEVQMDEDVEDNIPAKAAKNVRTLPIVVSFAQFAKRERGLRKCEQLPEGPKSCRLTRCWKGAIKGSSLVRMETTSTCQFQRLIEAD